MTREQFEHSVRAAGSVGFETPGTNGVTAWCLEPHDLREAILARIGA